MRKFIAASAVAAGTAWAMPGAILGTVQFMVVHYGSTWS